MKQGIIKANEDATLINEGNTETQNITDDGPPTNTFISVIRDVRQLANKVMMNNINPIMPHTRLLNFNIAEMPIKNFAKANNAVIERFISRVPIEIISAIVVK